MSLTISRHVNNTTKLVNKVLDEYGKREFGVDQERAGELVAVVEDGAWFTHYYWLDDGRVPGFAKTVEIHRKPGYDPAELFIDPADRTAIACGPRP